jgi:hypothetical protein
LSDEQLYALALSLVPDRDVAGDLYMDAANEADLRRRAAAWLGRRGLPVPAQDPPLPELTDTDRTFAAHLARRGRSRIVSGKTTSARSQSMESPLPVVCATGRGRQAWRREIAGGVNRGGTGRS